MNFSSKKIIALFLFFLGSQSIKSGTIAVFAQNGGHSGVTRSLLSGLKILGVPFSYNILHKECDTVIVLAGIEYLKEAIELKKAGKIKKLLAGPNLVTRADEYGGICTVPEVDVCLVPSEWVCVAYEEEIPILQGRIKVWSAGVNNSFLSSNNKKKSKIVLYWKTESEAFIKSIETLLQKYSFEVVRIRYGTYNQNQYHSLLSEAAVAIFVSVSESQGLALAEAWAMDVPTFVWNPEKLVAHGRVYSKVSSAPYLTTQTGCFWKVIDDLSVLMDKFMNKAFQFEPRKWMLHNCTDKHSAQCILNTISSIITSLPTLK